MNRIQRGIKTATKTASLSVEKHRVGAAIFLGKRLVSVGWNSKKTNPQSASFYHWRHAETSALIGTSKLNLANSTIYVARITRGGLVGIAKPCKNCQKFLRAAGIRNVVYTDKEGRPQKMKL